MKRLIFALLLVSAIYACKPGIPKDIIQPIEMEKVLYDIHLVDGYINSIPFPDSAKKIASGYYKGIYKKFGIDSALYNQSLEYYYAHPDVMKTMCDHISDRFSKAKVAQTKIEEKEQKARAKADSIKNVKLAEKAKKDTVHLIGPQPDSLKNKKSGLKPRPKLLRAQRELKKV